MDVDDEDRKFREAVDRFRSLPDAIRRQVFHRLLVDRAPTGRRGPRLMPPAERWRDHRVPAKMLEVIGGLVRSWNQQLPRHLYKIAGIVAYLEGKGYPGAASPRELDFSPDPPIAAGGLRGVLVPTEAGLERIRRLVAEELSQHRTLKRQMGAGRGPTLRLRAAVVCVQIRDRFPDGYPRIRLERKAERLLERLKKRYKVDTST